MRWQLKALMAASLWLGSVVTASAQNNDTGGFGGYPSHMTFGTPSNNYYSLGYYGPNNSGDRYSYYHPFPSTHPYSYFSANYFGSDVMLPEMAYYHAGYYGPNTPSSAAYNPGYNAYRPPGPAYEPVGAFGVYPSTFRPNAPVYRSSPAPSTSSYYSSRHTPRTYGHRSDAYLHNMLNSRPTTP